MKATVICHVFNEEYMLPFWLEHHKNVFDHGVIIDYRSTDASVAAVRRICPDWEVRTSRNAMFDAAETDAEVMDVEASVPPKGIKMALNVTEFIFLPAGKSLRSYFPAGRAACFRLEALTPVSFETKENPETLGELLEGLRGARLVRGARMGHRFVHSHETGRYTVGRHASALESEAMPDGVTLLWLGFFPWNERVIARKLQIRANIPETDVQRRFEILEQHTLTRAQLEQRRHALCASECVDSNAF